MTCQWPLWPHGARPTHEYCGKPGYPWCEEHRAIVFRSPEEYGFKPIKQPAPKKRAEPRKNVGQVVRTILIENPGISRSEVASRVGCTANYVSKIRRGLEGAKPKGDKAVQIRALFNTDLKDCEIASKVGVREEYVRAVRSRQKSSEANP